MRLNLASAIADERSGKIVAPVLSHAGNARHRVLGNRSLISFPMLPWLRSHKV